PFHFLRRQGKQLEQANQVVRIGRGVERQPLDPSLVARERQPPQEIVVRKGDTPREDGLSTHLHLDGAGCQGGSSCLLDPRGGREEGGGALIARIQSIHAQSDGEPAKEQHIGSSVLAVIVQGCTPARRRSRAA